MRYCVPPPRGTPATASRGPELRSSPAERAHLDAVSTGSGASPGLGTGEVELSHDGFGPLPPRRPVEHLRALAVHHGPLAEPDPHVVRFERHSGPPSAVAPGISGTYP